MTVIMEEIKPDPNHAQQHLKTNPSRTIIQFSGSSSPVAFSSSSSSSSSSPAASLQWTWDEHNSFVSTLMRVPVNTLNIWQLIATQIPGKSEKEVYDYYYSLCLLNMCLGMPPKSPSCAVAPPHHLPPKPPKRRKSWTKREHQLFLLGLEKFGKGNWKTIARDVVVSRTPSQVASHAQKFFLRWNKNKQYNRSSIYDITTVDRDFGVAFADQRHRNQSNHFQIIEQTPSRSSSLLLQVPLSAMPSSLSTLPLLAPMSLSLSTTLPPLQYRSPSYCAPNHDVFHNCSNNN